MPLKWFICPDGNRIEIQQCLDRCRRIEEGRCMALGNLIAASQRREWKGQPSVTQLIKPTRLTYLEITEDYAVDPDDMAFLLLGVWHHHRLELITQKLEGLTEQILEGEISGIFDRLEPDELHEGYYKLIDYKTSGAFSIAKAMGLRDENGTPDMREWELQLNYYRILLKANRKLGELFPVSRMFIQATVRDGGLMATKKWGVTKKMPLIPVRQLEDVYIKGYFARKRDALLSAIDSKTIPSLCDYEERWGNRRCRGYCSVADYCPEARRMNKKGIPSGY